MGNFKASFKVQEEGRRRRRRRIVALEGWVCLVGKGADMDDAVCVCAEKAVHDDWCVHDGVQRVHSGCIC
jgi:hypothetical protein